MRAERERVAGLTYAERWVISYAIYLLEAALEQDADRRWWQSPNRLWVGRVRHAVSTLRRLEPAPQPPLARDPAWPDLPQEC